MNMYVLNLCHQPSFRFILYRSLTESEVFGTKNKLRKSHDTRNNTPRPTSRSIPPPLTRSVSPPPPKSSSRPGKMLLALAFA